MIAFHAGHSLISYKHKLCIAVSLPSIHQIRSKEILCDYLHRAWGYPVKKTWLQAIKDGFFTTWPGLTYELVSKFLPKTSEEIATRYLCHQRQGIRSTGVLVVEQLNTVEMMELEY